MLLFFFPAATEDGDGSGASGKTLKPRSPLQAYRPPNEINLRHEEIDFRCHKESDVERNRKEIGIYGALSTRKKKEDGDKAVAIKGGRIWSV